MFRRFSTSLGRLATAGAGVQLGAAAAVALTDKELSKKPEWYQNSVRSLEEVLKRLSRYGFIESPSTLDEAHAALKEHADLHNTELQWRIARVLTEKADLTKDTQEQLHLLHEAKEAAKKALAVEPAKGSAGAHKWYGIILFKLAKLEKKANLEEEAEQHFGKAAALDPKDPYTLHFLGVIQYGNKKYADAITTLNKAEAIRAGFSPSNLYYLGAAQKGAGNKAAAIESLKKAYNAHPRNKCDSKAKSSAKGLLTSLGVKPEEYVEDEL